MLRGLFEGDETSLICRIKVIGSKRTIVGGTVGRLAAALLLVVSCVSCGGESGSPKESDASDVSTALSTVPVATTPDGDVELCSLATETLPGSAEEPASNQSLAASLKTRADAMATIAKASRGELADALARSSEAMSQLADAVTRNAEPDALDSLLTALSQDTEFVAAQEIIDAAVLEACKEKG